MKRDIYLNMSRRSIFRDKALEYYIQSREKSTLPRIARPPVALSLWALLGLCLSALALACLGQVPVYRNGVGVVLEQSATVLILMPASAVQPWHIDAGAAVHLQTGKVEQTINSTVNQVEAGLLGPGDIQKRYELGNRLPQGITGVSIVASVRLDAAQFSQISGEGSISVQVQVGTTSLFLLVESSVIPDGE